MTEVTKQAAAEQTAAEVDQTAKKKRAPDAELTAITKIRQVLGDLTPDARYRVLDYVRARVQAESFAKHCAQSEPEQPKAALVGAVSRPATAPSSF